MGSFFIKPINFLSLTLLFITRFGLLLPSSISEPDYTTLVYKGCSNQTFPDQNGVYSQTLKSLFDSLITQSSRSSFYQTNTGEGGGGQISFTGIYQCRGDLTNTDCYNCVRKIEEISDRFCGKTIAMRIQLYGCYMLYQIYGFSQISGVQMIYKVCGNSKSEDNGFEMIRDTVLSKIESGILSGNGFYFTSYESVNGMAQCEGDLSMEDCVECVREVVQKAQVECGNSINGQIYLNKCYLSYYSYSPSEVSTKSSSVGASQNTEKTIAIVVGGIVGVGLVVICLMFIRSLVKKHDDKY